MNIQTIIFLLTIILSNTVWSFNCIYTLAKDSCWTDYNVRVDIMDATTSKTLASVKVPAGTSWGRVQFVCSPAQTLKYSSQYDPIFWDSEKGITHQGMTDLTLPGTIPTDLAWTISACFSADFSEVPLPPNVKGNCACDFSSIPKPNPSEH